MPGNAISTSLKYTVVLPDANGALANTLLEKSIVDDNIVLLVIIGGDRLSLVEIADKRAAAYPYVRRVVWVTNPKLPELQQRLSSLTGGRTDVVVVSLSFTDKVVTTLRTTDTVDAMVIEGAFFKAQASV